MLDIFIVTSYELQTITLALNRLSIMQKMLYFHLFWNIQINMTLIICCTGDIFFQPLDYFLQFGSLD